MKTHSKTLRLIVGMLAVVICIGTVMHFSLTAAEFTPELGEFGSVSSGGGGGGAVFTPQNLTNWILIRLSNPFAFMT